MTETVTPVKFRAADGVVYERTGEKREPVPGELHWCEATSPAPYAFRWPRRTRWSPSPFWAQPEGALKTAWPCKHCGLPKERHERRNCPRSHKCAIWKVSIDQDWQAPEPKPTQFQNPIDQLIQRVQLTAGDLDGNNIPVLAMLYQSKALERIAALLESVRDKDGDFLRLVDVQRGSVYRTHLGKSLRPEEKSDKTLDRFPYVPGGWVCPMCKAGEHSGCAIVTYDGRCNCETCNLAPLVPGYKPHRFLGMEDNQYCAEPKCGAGRLHPIHQFSMKGG